MRNIFSQKSHRVILHTPRKTDKGKEKSSPSIGIEGSRTISGITEAKQPKPDIIWWSDLVLQQNFSEVLLHPTDLFNPLKDFKLSNSYKQRENKMFQILLARDYKMTGKLVLKAVT